MTTLLVASAGGHLKQLHNLSRTLEDIEGPVRWVTFDKPQSRALLGAPSDDVDFVRFIGSRDPKGALRGIGEARRIISRHRPETIISTGAAIALPFLGVGRTAGARCVYIESAARSEGPSMTGRLVARVPGVELFTQYERWEDDRWRYRGSIFDAYRSQPRPAPRPLRRVVVTLGTLKYDFSRLIDRLVQILPPDVDVLWQIGASQPSVPLPDAKDWVAEGVLLDAMRDADVVVAHAGVGSALAALDSGACPLLIPRRAARGEHVDDHQLLIAAELSSRGLASTVDADHLELRHLLDATDRSVTATLPSAVL